jgi:iron complex outermembrane receptor protein/outer membrane receptor for ferrienterochelin and colicins
MAFAQMTSSVRIIVKNNDTKVAISDAMVAVKETELKAITDTNGVAELNNVPEGVQTIEISSPGYDSSEIKLTFPVDSGSEHLVYLELNNEVGEVTIESTRTGREIEAEPTRVEAIDEEEIDEKISMRPANVSMVLHESTGIQVQQTSATSNTQSIRIQGLDGRYTQILKDGFPAFGGFSGSLSVLEIPPLDLKQVEVIKGPSATLFGGDAIAGVVNFITKDPDDKPVTTLIFNQTSALGTDFSVFNSRRYSSFGYTLLGSVNYQKAYDVDDDDFTELPRTNAFGFSPKVLFYLDDKTNLVIGNSTSYQNRKGGDIFVLRGGADGFHQYFERNVSFRNITTLNFNRTFADGSRILAKQSLAFFNREITTPNYSFKGNQFNSYTDVSYSRLLGKHAVIFGGSAVHDRFRENVPETSFVPRDETRTAVGAFVQDTIDITSKLALDAGLRIDHAKRYGTFALPRLSLLYRLSDNLTTRVGFGLGYKTPTMFTEESEMLLFRNVIPVRDGLKAERSRGATFDINYKGSIGEKFSYSINQMFFYTQIADPLVLTPDAKGFYRFSNSDSSVVSKGFETNARLSYGIAKLFLGYTLTDAKAGYLAGDRRVTLLPRNRINSSLVFESHENFKTGVEFYYGSGQTLDDRSRTRALGEVGLFGEKTLGKFSLFINAENLTDVRQGRYGRVVFAPHQNPTFAEIYTHTEGRIFNGGVKIRL